VHGDADRAGLVGDRSGDGLADPPGGVRGELVAAAVLELLDGLHQVDVAFLDQVEELQAAVGVLLGDGDHQAKVGHDQLLLGLIGLLFARADLADGLAQVFVRDAVEHLQLTELLLVLGEAALVEVAAGLVLLALEGLLVFADHGRGLSQLVVDVPELVDHPIARLGSEVDALQLVGELLLETGNGAGTRRVQESGRRPSRRGLFHFDAPS
jgi:hypothetical protein